MMMIQQFAAFCGTTAQTLRFYDQKGLLPADYVSPINGYRYYRTETAVIFHKIETLKRAGFTLAEIGEKLSRGDEQWMIESLEALIRRHQEKIALCEALKAEYAAKAAMIREVVAPSIEARVEGECLIIAQGENSVSAAYYSREAAEYCARIIAAGSRSDIFIYFGYDDVKELFADRCIAGTFTNLLPRCSIEELDMDAVSCVMDGAQACLCYVGFCPDTTSEDGVRFLEDISKLFGTNGKCIFAADIDMRYSSTIIDVVVIE